MKQEDKELLLKDLCGWLPSGVKCDMGLDYPLPLQRLFVDELDGILLDFYEDGKDYQVYLSEVRPYLFPLSSMTKEQSKVYHELIGGMFGTSALVNFEVLTDFFNTNHLDYRGLISMGLALDATGLNIY